MKKQRRLHWQLTRSKGMAIAISVILVTLVGMSLFPLIWNQSNESTLRQSPNALPLSQQFDYPQVLAKATRLVQQNELRLAIDLLDEVPQTDRTYRAAQLMRSSIAQEMLRRATLIYPQDIAQAIHMAEAIPKDTSAYPQAQSSLRIWQYNLQLLDSAQFSVEAGQWQIAQYQVTQIDPVLRSSKRVQKLLRDIHQVRHKVIKP